MVKQKPVPPPPSLILFAPERKAELTLRSAFIWDFSHWKTQLLAGQAGSTPIAPGDTTFQGAHLLQYSCPLKDLYQLPQSYFSWSQQDLIFHCQWGWKKAIKSFKSLTWKGFSLFCLQDGSTHRFAGQVVYCRIWSSLGVVQQKPETWEEGEKGMLEVTPPTWLPGKQSTECTAASAPWSTQALPGSRTPSCSRLPASFLLTQPEVRLFLKPISNKRKWISTSWFC